jgi:hypothetical protein
LKEWLRNLGNTTHPCLDAVIFSDWGNPDLQTRVVDPDFIKSLYEYTVPKFM